VDPDQERLFRERYQVSGEDALIEAEIEVLGSNYQANGYTTLAQADLLLAALQLESGDSLLDLGSGCGWPGLYMASSTGSSLLSIDPVLEGAATAAARARLDGISDRVLATCGSGENLPVRSGSIDAVVHTDVLC
jgi:cyclopropane fatty-acyl-phospholipid synthase-like methyltransferase